MNDRVNEGGKLKEYGPDDAAHAEGRISEPRVRRGIRRLIAEGGAAHVLRELASLFETHGGTMILDSAKLAFVDAAAHIHRAGSLVDGYLVPAGPPDPMIKVLGEVRAIGIGKGREDHEVIEFLLREYRDAARKLNEAEDKALSATNFAALRKTLENLTSHTAAYLETLNANGIASELLAVLNDPAETCEVTATSVELLRNALLLHAKDTNPHDTASGFTRQAAAVIATQAKQIGRLADLNKRLDVVEASVAQEVAREPVTTDKITGHPIGCEAHFAGIRFHCHKTHRNDYADRKQTFVTFEVYATTELDREAIAALRSHADTGMVAPLHAPPGVPCEGFARVSAWPNSIDGKSEVTFQFELHATKEEGEEANRHRFGHQGHADAAKVIASGSAEMLRGETIPRVDGLYGALVDMMGLLWKARFHAEPTTENTGPAADFVTEHQATLEKLAAAFADPIDDKPSGDTISAVPATSGSIMADVSAISPHAKGFEPFVATPENDPTPSDADIVAATLKLIDGGTMISTYDGGPPAGGPRTEAALKKLADFGTIERWQDGNHTCYGSRITRAMLDPNFGSNFGPRAHASTSDETDPRNQVANLVREHGGFGRLCINGQPFAASVNATSSGLFIHGEESALSEPMRLLVAITELEAQAPTDLKGHGFTDATMLSPVPSGSARSHAATCLAYAGLLHDLRQALQRSLSGLAISARHNAEQSSDALAYWTAELARMPIPASGFRPSTAT